MFYDKIKLIENYSYLFCSINLLKFLYKSTSKKLSMSVCYALKLNKLHWKNLSLILFRI